MAGVAKGGLPTDAAPQASPQQQLDDIIERIPPPPNHFIRPDSSTPSSISLSYRIDSNINPARDPKPKAGSRRKRMHGSHWRRAFEAIKFKYRKLWGRSRRRPASHGDSPFDRTIQIIFKDEQGNEILRHARAKFDTGNPENLISSAFLSKFGSLIPIKRNKRVILELPGGGKYTSVGRLSGRWTCKLNDPPLHFDAKFMDAEFEVSNSAERFDVVIGSNTIQKEHLLEVRHGLALTGFRTKTPSYTREFASNSRSAHE